MRAAVTYVRLLPRMLLTSDHALYLFHSQLITLSILSALPPHTSRTYTRARPRPGARPGTLHTSDLASCHLLSLVTLAGSLESGQFACRQVKHVLQKM